MTETTKLSAYVEPSLPAKRIDAQWSRLAAREEKWTRRFAIPWRLYGALGAVSAIALAVFFGRSWESPRNVGVGDGVAIEQGSTGESRVLFGKDIVAVVSHNSSLSLVAQDPQETRLLLSRGQARFDVTHREGRRVVVSTPGYDIEVVGTQFTVRVASDLTSKPAQPSKSSDVTVEVLRGTVQVAAASTSERRGSASSVSRVTAGQVWSSPGSEQAAPVSQDSGQDSGQDSSQDSRAPSVPASAASVSPLPSERLPPKPTAKELFEVAERARVAGRLVDAASALDTLSKGYPSDPRAALAAFELGRIRMDSLGDNAGALAAFSSATRLSSGGAFREDADARVVQLYERLGKREACRLARARYLTAFPQGRHLNAVSAACAR